MDIWKHLKSRYSFQAWHGKEFVEKWNKRQARGPKKQPKLKPDKDLKPFYVAPKSKE